MTGQPPGASRRPFFMRIFSLNSELALPGREFIRRMGPAYLSALTGLPLRKEACDGRKSAIAVPERSTRCRFRGHDIFYRFEGEIEAPSFSRKRESRGRPQVDRADLGGWPGRFVVRRYDNPCSVPAKPLSSFAKGSCEKFGISGMHGVRPRRLQ